ncbi:hypothetical protein QQS21_005929 [Conoideocrella luteorostrata]|uniref:COP9 signalosome complex subunit 3 N-terminal helical repeats domain-containing protein n=1 Tax=Conoideocrella luteorostrata TaxID=1105319 RepID=A0AAJ0CNI5_9HYPO|nr:hypothetical protein QQS21_005929 [Conoideocrella luteorostrata]
MDEALDALTALDPVVNPTSKAAIRAYDTSITQHIGTLNGSAAEIRSAVLSHPEHLLKHIDPSVHSIGFIFILQIISEPTNAALSATHQVLLDGMLDFLLKFDPVQVRYVGQHLLSLLNQVATGQVFPPSVAVKLLSTAILRIDPTGSTFTSTHLRLAQLAYQSNFIESAMPVIDRDILFYPNGPGSKENSVLCDPALAPASFVTTQTGLTDKINATTVLEYNYLRGLIYMSRRDWGKAVAAFEQAISHPLKDRTTSRIMLDSYKRWVLVGLLDTGEAPTAPSYTSASANSTYKATAKPYNIVAELFSTAEAEKLKEQIEENAQTWEEDGTVTLLAEILAAYQKWQIIRLGGIYQHVDITHVRESTLSAETGRPLENDDAVVALISQMIESGMLAGQIEQHENSTYLSFRQDSDMISEMEFARQLAQSHHNIETLGKQYRQMNDQLSGSKEYVKHLVREQRRGDKGVADAGIGFDSQIEDEDLMNDDTLLA